MQSVETPIAPEKMPRHVAIIMDGNGRWAKERGLPRSMGHRQGVLALRPVIEQSIRWGVPYLTLFAFSTENWARPKEEVGALMGLIEEFFYREVEELRSQGVRIRILGELSALPERPRRLVERAVELTEPNRRLTLSLALNYGGRAELARAARLLAQEAAHLFSMPPERIQVVVHRESIVHSAVEFADGALLAQLGLADMRLPIAYAMSYPERLPLPGRRLDLTALNGLHFERPDEEAFPAARLGHEALRLGGVAPAALNGANERCVELFLAGKLAFPDIADLAAAAMRRAAGVALTLENALAADAEARAYVQACAKPA